MSDTTTKPGWHDLDYGVCNGTCVPMCDECLLGHECPETCGGGEDCPYNKLHLREALTCDDY